MRELKLLADLILPTAAVFISPAVLTIYTTHNCVFFGLFSQDKMGCEIKILALYSAQNMDMDQRKGEEWLFRVIDLIHDDAFKDKPPN